MASIGETKDTVKNPSSTNTTGVPTATPVAAAAKPYSQQEFDWKAYAQENGWMEKAGRLPNNDNEGLLYQDYVKNGSKWVKGQGNSDKEAAKNYTTGGDVNTKNVEDFANETIKQGSENVINKANGTSLVDATKNQAGTASQVDPNAVKGLGTTPTVKASTVAQQTPTDANGYDVTKTQDQVKQNQMDAAQGTVSDKAIIDPNEVPQADMQGISTGVNKDGTKNFLGEALNKYASQGMSSIIDTSTAAGKALAEQMGEGNYVDSKATMQGQLALLQSQFVDPNTGEPKIPSWAAATARNVSKIAAFSGMSGSAATAAMSQALMEASLPIAQSDSQFFQTLTVKNLDNKQQSILNTATVLAKFEQTNLDNRMQAAVTNAQSFLAMDMKNLDNEQQSRVINNQSMIQSILEDAKQENVKKQFMAQSQNDLDKFYASLNTSISQFNSTQTLDASKFNASLEDSRQKFYSEQSYNLAIANANWRQQTTLQDDQQKFEAATTDVKNSVDLSVNQLNQIWDRADSLLDYAFQQSENNKNRQAQIAIEQFKAKSQKEGATMAGIGSIVGSFVGSDTFSSMLDKMSF